jgi:uncharacterized protein (TIGR03437 family)
VSVAQSAIIKAETGTLSVTFTLQLAGPNEILAVNCSPNQVLPGETTSCLVSLSGPATKAIDINLASSSPGIALPQSIQCTQGQSQILIEIVPSQTALAQTVMITAAAGSSWASGVFAIMSLTAPVLNVPQRLTVTAPGTAQFTVSASDPNGLPLRFSAAGVPSGASFSSTTRTFKWSVGPQDTGLYVVSFTATNSSNVSATKLVAVQVLGSALQIAAVTNAASYATDMPCSAGSLASVFGSGFTSGIDVNANATTVPFPTQLSGVSISLNGQAIPLLYVSDQLINFQCPSSPAGLPMTIVFQGANSETGKIEFTEAEASPGIFSTNESGQGQGAVLVAATSFVAGSTGTGSRPAHPGEYIEIFATGLGPTDSPVAPGNPAPLTKLIRAVLPVSVAIGGEPVVPEFAGLAPGFAGLWQINVRLPVDISSGVAIPLQVSVTLSEGTIVNSNIVTIAIE